MPQANFISHFKKITIQFSTFSGSYRSITMGNFLQFILLLLLINTPNAFGADSTAILKMAELAKQLQNEEPERALQLADSVTELSMKEGFHAGYIEGLIIKGKVSYSLNRLQLAEECFESALQTAITENLKEAEGSVLLAQSQMEIGRGNYTRALRKALKSQEIFRKSGDALKEGKALNNIAMIYAEQNKDSLAIRYYRESIRLKLQSGDTLSTATTYNNIGLAYIHLKQYKMAIGPIDTAYQIKQRYGVLYTADNLTNLALAWEGMGDNEKAKKYYLKAIQVFELPEVGDEMMAVPLANLGEIYFREGNLTEAGIFFSKSASNAEKFNNKEDMIAAYDYLVAFYKKTVNPERVIEFLEKRRVIADSLAIEKSNEAIAEMMVLHDIQQEQNANAMLKKQNELQQLRFRNKTIIGLSILVMLIASGIIFWFSSRNRELKLSQEKIILEQKLLRSQMNPHFIFNAVNGIQSKILQKQELEAYTYLTRFSQLLREVLINTHEDSVSLHQELETLKLYLTLEQMRFEEKFTFEVKQSPEIDLHEVMVPSMILQPFAENAIWHGLMPLEINKTAKLTIEIFKKGQGIIVTIEDNGIGRDKSEELKKGFHHKSLGISLTRQRLALYKNETGSITIKDLKDASGKAAGTRIEILI